MTKQEHREKQMKDLKRQKDRGKAKEFNAKIAKKLTCKAKQGSHYGGKEYMMQEAKFIAHDILGIEPTGFSDATIDKIINASIHELIFLVNKENYDIPHTKKMPFDYYTPGVVKYDFIKDEIDRVLSSITFENKQKLRKKIISQNIQLIVKDLKALYEQDMSIFELFSNYKINQYLTVDKP